MIFFFLALLNLWSGFCGSSVLDCRRSHLVEQVRKKRYQSQLLSAPSPPALVQPQSRTLQDNHLFICAFSTRGDVSSLHQHRLECESASVRLLSALFSDLFVNTPPLIIASLLAVWQHLQQRFSPTKFRDIHSLSQYGCCHLNNFLFLRF